MKKEKLSMRLFFAGLMLAMNATPIGRSWSRVLRARVAGLILAVAAVASVMVFVETTPPLTANVTADPTDDSGQWVDLDSAGAGDTGGGGGGG